MSSIDWQKIRDTLPPVAEDDPALILLQAQIAATDKNPPEGIDSQGKPWAEIYREYRQFLLDEMERYRWRKAGYEPTQEMLDACR